MCVCVCEEGRDGERKQGKFYSTYMNGENGVDGVFCQQNSELLSDF